MEHYYETLNGWSDFVDLYKRMVEYFPSGSRFVEVGCWEGRSVVYMAVEIINSGKDIKFYCVDTWKGSGEHQGAKELLTLYDVFKKNIEPVKDYVTPIQEFSAIAADTFEDESLDFVFLDAAHSYEDLKDDGTHWYPKIKKGGFIAGHDLAWEGIEKAVTEMFPDYKKEVGGSWVHKK